MQVYINLVGQDAEFNRIITLFLRQEGYEVRQYRSCEEVFVEETAQLWIVDIHRPTVKGYDGLKKIKQKHPRVPIIITTLGGTSADRLLSLEIGADDYMEKPIEPRELVLRSQRLLGGIRRNQIHGLEKLRIQDYIIDVRSRTVSFHEGQIQLTSKEFDLLMMFARYSGQALSREQILDAVWGVSSYYNYRVVDDLVRRIRCKMKGLRIETLYGHGYRSCLSP